MAINSPHRNRSLQSLFAVWNWSLWAKWFWGVTALVLLVVSYPASFGPACWIAARSPHQASRLEAVSTFYGPVALMVLQGPEWFSSLMRSSIQFGLPADVELMDDPRGIVLVFPTFTYTILWM